MAEHHSYVEKITRARVVARRGPVCTTRLEDGEGGEYDSDLPGFALTEEARYGEGFELVCRHYVKPEGERGGGL